jgi:multidrug efflux pump subunit AcrA (membrane-fusion protein)
MVLRTSLKKFCIPEVTKAAQRNVQMELHSPANGTVQQLAVHTVGGVVTPAPPLLSVVPEDESLEVEVTILNKDIGNEETVHGTPIDNGFRRSRLIMRRHHHRHFQ